MISISAVLLLQLGGVGQQGYVARLLDGFGQSFLVRRAHAGNPPRSDLAAFGKKIRESADILVVDVVDFLDTEAANFLPPEILFFPGGNRFVAAGGTLGCRNRAAATLFWHKFLLKFLFSLPGLRPSLRPLGPVLRVRQALSRWIRRERLGRRGPMELQEQPQTARACGPRASRGLSCACRSASASRQCEP